MNNKYAYHRDLLHIPGICHDYDAVYKDMVFEPSRIPEDLAAFKENWYGEKYQDIICAVADCVEGTE